MIQITYSAFNQTHIINFDYNTQIGKIHGLLYSICNTYVLLNIKFI